MALASAADIKKLGFDAGFWGIDDEVKLTGDKTALDEFLESYMWEAAERLLDWVGAVNYDAAAAAAATDKMKIKLTRAEMCLTLAEILPIAWARAGTGEESLSFEGMSIRIARTSADEQERTVQSVLAKAERLAAPWSSTVDFGGVEAV